MAATTQNTDIMDTYTVSEFKALKGAENRAIEVKQNPHTGKLFMVIGSTAVGAVSTKIDFSKKLGIIKFTDGTFCLCNPGEGAPTVATL